MHNQPIHGLTDDDSPPCHTPPSSSPPNPEPRFGFTPAQARGLNRKKGMAYKQIQDRDGTQWLVDWVVDNGRLIALLLPGTNGTIYRVILPREYADYAITLGPGDM